MSDNVVDKEKNYWLEKLAGEPEKSIFPYDTIITPNKNDEKEKLEINFPQELCNKLDRVTNKSDKNLFVFLTAALTFLLGKYSTNDDIILIVPIYKQQIDGQFINTLLNVRNRLDYEKSFRDLIIQVKNTLSEANRHPNYPLDRLMYHLGIKTTGSDVYPLSEIAVILENIHKRQYLDSIKLSLIFSFTSALGRIDANVEFDPGLYRKKTIETIMNRFIFLLTESLLDVNRPLSDIRLVSVEEERQLAQFNDTVAQYPRTKTVRMIFEEQVSRNSENIAVVGYSMSRDRQCSLPYRQLNREASMLAYLLREKGVIPGTIAAIMVEPSVEMIIALVAIWKTGAAYLPMAPEHPEERIRYMLTDSNARVLITHHHLAQRYAGTVFDHHFVIDVDDPALYEGECLEFDSGDTVSDTLYAIFTSGTTGNPKGVLIKNENIVNYVNWFCQTTGLTSNDKTILTSSYIFDLGYSSIYPALMNGCELHVPDRELYMSPEDFLNYIRIHKITYLKMTPSLLNVMVNNSCFAMKYCLTLRLVVCGGEAINLTDMETLNQRCPHVMVMNHYGPTEATIGCIARFIDFDNYTQYLETPTIGSPINNMAVIIMDKQSNPVPIGMSGEICLGGIGLAKGYLNRPILTADCFFKYSYMDYNTFYRTGDLGRWHNDGNIEFLGRIDHQIKIRGYRIELGEIEYRLLKHPNVVETAVIPVEISGAPALCAYMVTQEQCDASYLKEFLSHSLPEYMVPPYFVFLEMLPLTPNGKLDRKALPLPDAGNSDAYVAPRSEMEEKLAEIWAQVLGKKRSIGIDDSFFEMGGNSLSAVTMVSRIHKELNIKVPLAEIFRTPTIMGLAESIGNSAGAEEHFRTINPIEKREYYPLSSAQKRMFTLQQLDAGGIAYNMPQFIPLSEKPHAGKLEKTFKSLIARHESLRTSFLMLDKEEAPVQRVHDILSLEFEIEYLYGNSGSDDIAAGFVRSFDLYKAPLLRIGLLEKDGQYLLLTDKHHIISDGVSRQVLIKDFMKLFRDQELPPLTIQYKDYSMWQNSAKEQERIKEQETYWIEQFSDCLPTLDLYTDFPRKAVPDFKGNTLRFDISSDNTRSLENIALSESTSLFMVLLAVFYVLLAKLGGREDIVVGTPIAGRKHADLEKIIGMFVNTLALRNFPRRNQSFNAFMKDLTQRTLQAYENQDYQFEDLVDKLDLPRDMSRNPIFDVAFSLQNIDTGEDDESVLREKAFISTDFNMQYQYMGAKFDISVIMTKGDRLYGSFEYSTSLFKQETIERYIDYFKKIVAIIADKPNTLISAIDIISGIEKKQLLETFNDSYCSYPVNKTLWQLFEDQVEKTPDHIALSGDSGLIDPPDTLSYLQLFNEADKVAAVLVERNVGPNTIVGIMTQRCLQMIIGILGILKTGGAYLPIDPEYPLERKAFMLADSSVNILLTTSQLKKNANLLTDTILIDSVPSNDSTRIRSAGPDDLAYIIYTSGSTGKPKGVPIRHRSIVNTLYWRKNLYCFDENDTVLQIPSFSFDSSVEDIFTPLISGSKLALITTEHRLDLDYLKEYIPLNNVTHFLIVPGLYGTFLDNFYQSLQGLRCITVAGDNFTSQLVEDHFLKLPHVELYNEYGPTENSVCSTIYRFNPGNTKILIGVPISNAKCFILDENLQLNPVGVPGELCVSGPGLSDGYLNRPQLTAEKFINWFNGIDEFYKIYRTGDRARWLADGNIEFLGRLDHQVKIRGFRVELGEIEYRILGCGDVKETVVIARKNRQDETELYAYVVSANGPDFRRIRETLLSALPEYMVPTHFISLDKIPLNPNGKIDRKALPIPQEFTETLYQAPRNEIEEKLVDIWAEILGKAPHTIGIDANFFQLGGHSLKATVLVSRIHKAFNIKITLAEVFKRQTVRDIAGYLQQARIENFFDIDIAEPRPYYPLSHAQKRLFLLQQMEPDSCAYNMPQVINLPMHIRREQLSDAFNRLILRHESLRTSFHMVDNEPMQIVHDNVSFILQYNDTVTDPQTIINGFVRPFNLSRPPLIRARLIKVDNQRYDLLVDMHHIISDGVSQRIIEDEFSALVAGNELPSLRLQYKDYAVWQNRDEHRNVLTRQETYWLDRFAGEIPILDLPIDFLRPAVQDFTGAGLMFRLPASQTNALKQSAARQGGTLFMVLLAVINVFLAKITSQEDVIIGTPIAARRHPDLEPIIGMFVNTLALRNFPSGHKSFNQFLLEVKDQTLEAFENQEYPFEELVENVSVNRDISRNPLFDVMFSMQNIFVNYGEANEPNPPSSRNAEIFRSAKFDLMVFVSQKGSELDVTFQYAVKLFKAESIRRFSLYFQRIVSAVADDADRMLSDIEIISEEEKHQVLFKFNNPYALYPEKMTIGQWFQEQATRFPENISVESTATGNGPVVLSLTYKEFMEQILQLAAILRERGLDTGDIAAVMMDRSVEMVRGIMAVLVAGGTYLPIDPEYPPDRKSYILNDSKAKLLLTTAFRAQESSLSIETIHLEAVNVDSMSAAPLATAVPVQADALAYIIYTSGSTGKPKGVMVEHNGVVNLLSALQKMYPLEENDAYLLKTAYIFDVSVTELFGWFPGGGRLAVLEKGAEKDPRKIISAVKNNSITHMNFVPSMFGVFSSLLDSETITALASMKYIFLAGEVLPPNMVRNFHELGTGIKLENIYGPTEGTVYSTYYSTDSWDGQDNILIGRPLENIKIYILDRYQRLQPVGVAGELCLAGIGTARGYLNRPQLTAQRFIYWSEGADEIETLYRTGDLARWLADGQIEYLGRMDYQVKIRGYRIELGEVENRLLQHNALSDSVVIVVETSSGDLALCAYIVPAAGTDKIPTQDELRDYAARTLPDYMIPSFFVQLESIPLTPGGKIDRNALPAHGLEIDNEYVPPQTPLEKKMVEIWSEVLGVEMENVGINNNFFRMGGHSLKAAVMAARIHKETDVEIPLVEIFKNPYIQRLARYIRDAEKESFFTPEPAEKREYYPLFTAQQGVFVQQYKQADLLAYNMPQIHPLPMPIDRDRLQKAFEAIIQRHEIFRTSFLLMDEEPVQKIHEHVSFTVGHFDLTGWQTGIEIRVREIIRDFVKPFDLAFTPQLRAALITLTDNDHILVWDMHHIVTDAISNNIFRKELTALYDGEILPPLSITYKDFSVWLRSDSAQRIIDRQKEYWLKLFDDPPPVLKMPVDFKRGPRRSFEGEIIRFTIEKSLTSQIKQLMQLKEITIYMILLSAYFILLSRYADQDDIVIGSPVTGRRHPDLQGIIGMFVNMMALRCRPRPNKTIATFLDEVKSITIDSVQNQDYHYEELVRQLKLQGNPGRNPLFDVVFLLGGMDTGFSGKPETAIPSKNSPGGTGSNYEFEFNIIPFDMILQALERGDVFQINLAYSIALFKRSTVETICENYKEVLKQICTGHESKIGDISISHGLMSARSKINEEELTDFDF